ncbi:histidine decarboxylase [Salmonella enterica]|uniref:Histidine decarboxylase n=3 Tax=Salmonella enterica TaxID=28901 RepID=A0A747XAY4_SALER|nr:histidine decarboxylase [Salmonella enterica subsp. enterica serovar Pomona]EBB2613854.1 histidine decarboxylase [Salmonella enterica]EBG9603164.1 histidine decarboxylase [Salmonella enterica subsp. enterica serovar Arechavaleta]EBV0540540.1 histidine decarboxylase [Salmonella enterica subsp. enterica serovar Glostrup]ECT8456496.1 histidine decarboxylase [Salmonella enterica subsp. enterica serovar Panama]EDB3637903.1 histidine decarboxylase [Salmonella enterica subsp. enterica serovar Oran
MQLTPVDQKKLDEFYNFCKNNKYHVISYPDAADLDVSILNKFNEFVFNNYGDWAEDSNYILNTFEFEREVIEWFAKLLNIDINKCWGYVTNGGTEGNMYGCLLGRECFPNGKLYYSKQTHYSVAKIVSMLRIEGKVIKEQPNGEIDYDDLIQKIKENNDPHPIIFANIGTTVTAAVDDIKIIQKKMTEAGYEREDYYIHSDAALSGMIIPFCDDPQPFDFADGADSVTISGHKVIGTKIPCGVVLAKKENVAMITHEIEYIAAHDKTITGSRNGHTPLMMWLGIKQYTYDQHKARIKYCIDNAQYAVDKFNEYGIKAWRNKNSTTVVFPKPSVEIINKWLLSTEGERSHLVICGHHKDKNQINIVIDDIVTDLRKRFK